MWAAVSASVLAVRAQMARCAPSRDSSSAAARPSPLLAAATMATRPVSPRSIPAPYSKLQSSRETRNASIMWFAEGERHGGAILRDFFFCDIVLNVYIRTDNLRYRKEIPQDGTSMSLTLCEPHD